MNDSNKTISSGYIFCEDQAIDTISRNQIQLSRSPMSKRYEPHSNILANTNLLDGVRDSYNKRYPNYYKDLHKLMIDIRNSNSLSTIRNNYISGRYKIAFEDFDKVRPNKSIEFRNDLKKVIFQNGNLIVEEITKDEDTQKPTDILFDDGIREIETRLFISPEIIN